MRMAAPFALTANDEASGGKSHQPNQRTKSGMVTKLVTPTLKALRIKHARLRYTSSVRAGSVSRDVSRNENKISSCRKCGAVAARRCERTPFFVYIKEPDRCYRGAGKCFYSGSPVP